MAVLEILEFPDPRLRTVAKPVTSVSDQTRALIDDMFETMYDAPGIGLAATQVNVHERILVIDVSEDKSQPLVFINPEVEVLEAELGESESTKLIWQPTTTTELDLEGLTKLMKLVDTLEEDDDVQTVTTNFEASDEVMEAFGNQ